jgi:lipase ATG15
MKISFFLQNIFTHSSILQLNPSSLVSQTKMYDIDINPDKFNFDTNFDLPINFDVVQNMLYMSYDAYLEKDDSKWQEVEYNKTIDISLDQNSIRGYLFSDETKMHNIIAVKGTSISFIPMVLSNFLTSNSTVVLDKFNDNLFFGCCFYKESNLFKNYCQNDNNDKTQCSKQCYKDSTNIDLNYIGLFENIINNVKKVIDFDNSNVYFTGHSLGSFLANIIGMKYNKQVIGFDSPGTRHYVKMLNLTGNTNRIYNFGHTADSIMHGDCQSVCKLWGYNLDTECHIGNTCIYDSKKKLGYFDGIRYHQLKWIIDYILPHWENDFPECVFNKPCKERNCDKWDYN